MDNWKRFDEKSIPDEKEFYLNTENITDVDTDMQKMYTKSLMIQI